MRGTAEGDIEEIKVTQSINKRDTLGLEILNIMGLNKSDVYAVNVVGMVYGKLQKRKIKPKSDIFLIKSDKITEDYLKLNQFYLKSDNSHLTDFIPYTGISIKLSDSNRYQILKINPSTFKMLYGSCILGAGASIYCVDKKDFHKNIDVLKAWGVTMEDFVRFYSNVTKDVQSVFGLSDNSIASASKIKKFSNDEIKRLSLNNKDILEYIFSGKGNFEEPYIAHWIFEKGKFKKLEPYDFIVTTGSGRSKGDYTIVFKPV
jgi:hypothetical protein